MIIALQYYKGDRDRTFSLARLLADIEPVPRNDILLALVCQPDTPSSPLTNMVMQYCARKFSVVHVVSPRKAPAHPNRVDNEGFPVDLGQCGQLWAGTMEYFSNLFEKGNTPHDSILTLDGGDGVPLHLDWINMFKQEHVRTLSMGKLITGTHYNLWDCPLHVNPNAIFHLSTWTKFPSLHDVPLSDGTLSTHFDIYHRRVMLDNSSLTSIVRTDWRGAGNRISVELMRERAKKSIWLHGYKDNNLYQVARSYLSSSETSTPILERHQLENLDSILIPKTIHYIWLGQKPMHPLMDQWRAKWASLHPSWTIKVWRETPELPSNQLMCGNEILECRHPNYLTKCPTLAKRSDVWRYDLLEQHGGLYLDTDYEPIKCIEEIVSGKTAFAGQCLTRYGWTENDPVGKVKTEIGCALIGATPHHPWLLDLFNGIEKQDPINQLSLAFPYITEITSKHPEVHLFSPDTFYPVRWDQYANPPQIYRIPPPKTSYAAHQWSSNWFSNGLKRLPSFQSTKTT
jgi:Glycosyltransferase sugar-binding region containing DXD motif